eukprot:gb/GEZN01009405.1/.p1 GENE.gb/GEZN01009405.1/~~gb/GEZN01009405.1/.p1  ORF type:complete len:187 (+),score=17.11 gb/GEZN01009405.1/:559-1119(+)
MKALSISKLVYTQARAHYMLNSFAALPRTWCLYEVLLRMEAKGQTVSCDFQPDVGGGYFAAKSSEVYRVAQTNYFSEMQATVASDAEQIKKLILEKMTQDEFNNRVKKFVFLSLSRREALANEFNGPMAPHPSMSRLSKIMDSYIDPEGSKMQDLRSISLRDSLKTAGRGKSLLPINMPSSDSDKF